MKAALDVLLDGMPDLGLALFLFQQAQGKIQPENGRFKVLIDRLIKSPDEYREKFKQMMNEVQPA